MRVHRCCVHGLRAGVSRVWRSGLDGAPRCGQTWQSSPMPGRTRTPQWTAVSQCQPEPNRGPRRWAGGTVRKGAGRAGGPGSLCTVHQRALRPTPYLRRGMRRGAVRSMPRRLRPAERHGDRRGGAAQCAPPSSSRGRRGRIVSHLPPSARVTATGGSGGLLIPTTVHGLNTLTGASGGPTPAGRGTGGEGGLPPETRSSGPNEAGTDGALSLASLAGPPAPAPPGRGTPAGVSPSVPRLTGLVPRRFTRRLGGPTR